MKLVLLTFDDRTPSVDRLMPTRRAESAAVVRCPQSKALQQWLPDMDSNHE
jgi:hypothetical protein